DGHRRIYFKEYDTPQTNHGIANNLDFDRPRTGFLKLGYGDFTLEGAYLFREKGLANGVYGTVFNDPHNRQRDTLSYIDLKYAHDFSGWEVEARASFNEYRYRGWFPYDNVLPDDPSRVVL